MTLSTTVDATYGDDPANPSQKQHQQDHDVIHAAVNGLPTTYGPRTRQIPVWQANHAYAVGDEYVDRAPASHRRWRVTTAYTSGPTYGTTDTTNSAVHVFADGDTRDWGWLEAPEGLQNTRIVTNQALWVNPDQSVPTDALFVRASDPTRGGIELEGALAGPGSSRVMGIVVWDTGTGSLVWQINGQGDVLVGEQRHFCGGQTAATATAVAAGAQAGTSPPAPVLQPGSTDMQGTVLFGTGTAPARGLLVNVTFGRAFTDKPHIVIAPMTYDTPGIQPMIDWQNHVSTTGFSISANIAPAASQAAGFYGVSYHVFGY